MKSFRFYKDNDLDHSRPSVFGYTSGENDHDEYDEECGQSCTWLWYLRAIHQPARQGKIKEAKVM